MADDPMVVPVDLDADPVIDAGPVVTPAPPEQVKVKPMFRINVDADGVYWGATEIHPEDAQPADVVLEAMPDNRQGCYRWNAIDRRFDPLPVSQQKIVQTAPDLERTFDALCEALAKSMTLPPLVVEWRSWYAKTIDQKK